MIATRFDTLDELNEDLAEDISNFDDRMTALQTRLASQFAYNDAIIATLNTTLSYLTQQFEAMSNAQKN